MKNKANIYSSYEKEDNENDDGPIIVNNSEFCSVKDLISNKNGKTINTTNNVNRLEHNRAKSKKLNNFYKINTPTTKCCSSKMNLYSLILQSEDNNSIDDKLKVKIFNINKKSQNQKIKKYIDVSKKDNRKPVFTKISEDMYLKFKSKPNKEIRDINKMEEDAYNKMTSDQYILTCKNKENIKNKKILRNFLDRKVKEGTFKKIGIECDRSIDINKLQDFKRALTVTDRNINFKSTRTFEQFLKDQKNIPVRKNKKVKYKNAQLPRKGNILPQDSTYIFTDKKKYLDAKENDLESNYSENHEFKSLYNFLAGDEEEEFFNKTFEMENEIKNSDMNFSLINEDNSIINDLKPKEKNSKNDKNKRESSSITKSKKYNGDNIAEKFLIIYKNILLNNFGNKIEDIFDINFSGFLFLIYKLGFINKNYPGMMNELECELLDKTEHLKEFSSFASNSDISKLSFTDLNLNLTKTKEYINNFKNDKEFQLCIDAWKIITEKQIFNEDITLSSQIIFVFLISVLGLCNDEKNEKILKKECLFFFNDKKLVQQYNNRNKYIYKYFKTFNTNAMNKIFKQDKKQKQPEVLSEETININDNNKSDSFSISLSISNTDSNYENYNIYKKNYNKNENQNKGIDNNNNKLNKNNIKKNELDDDSSTKLFNEGIKENNNFFNIDKSKQSMTFFSDLDNSDNNSINLINNSMIDSSIFCDIKNMLKEEIKNNSSNDDDIEVDSTLLKDNKNYFQYGKQETNKSNYTEIKSYIQNDEKNDKNQKKIKYIFEIKIEDKPQKLILTKDDNKINVLNKFCKKFGINNIEKNKILKVINEQLKNLDKINKQNN